MYSSKLCVLWKSNLSHALCQLVNVIENSLKLYIDGRLTFFSILFNFVTASAVISCVCVTSISISFTLSFSVHSSSTHRALPFVQAFFHSLDLTSSPYPHSVSITLVVYKPVKRIVFLLVHAFACVSN